MSVPYYEWFPLHVEHTHARDFAGRVCDTLIADGFISAEPEKHFYPESNRESWWFGYGEEIRWFARRFLKKDQRKQVLRECDNNSHIMYVTIGRTSHTHAQLEWADYQFTCSGCGWIGSLDEIPTWGEAYKRWRDYQPNPFAICPRCGAETHIEQANVSQGFVAGNLSFHYSWDPFHFIPHFEGYFTELLGGSDPRGAKVKVVGGCF